MILQTGSLPGDKLTFCAETSTPRGSLALLKGAEVLGGVEWNKEASHSESIAIFSQDLLSKYNLTWRDIHQFGCGIGPGSFTGIRVAFNFVRSLSFFFSKPMIVATSFDLALAPVLKKGAVFLVTHPAFRNLIYIQILKVHDARLEVLLPSCALTLEQIKKALSHLQQPAHIVGAEANTVFKFLEACESKKLLASQVDSWPKAQNFSYLTHSNHFKTRPMEWKETSPLYIRASEAEEKLRLAMHVNS